MLTVGAVLTFLPLPATTVVIDVALVWLGYLVLAGSSRPVGGRNRAVSTGKQG